MDIGLTPLGERRPNLPLHRKVKQLQRPWQEICRAPGTAPRLIWSTSQSGLAKGTSEGARFSTSPPNKRSGERHSTNEATGARLRTSRRRPMSSPVQLSLGSSPPRPCSRFQSPLSTSLQGACRLKPWGMTAAAARGVIDNLREVPPSAVRPGARARCDLGITLSEKESLQTTAEITVFSSISGPSLFACGKNASTKNDDNFACNRRESCDQDQKIRPDHKTTHSPSVGEPKNVGTFSPPPRPSLPIPYAAAGLGRPVSAGALFNRDPSFSLLRLRGDKIARPQTACVRNSTRCALAQTPLADPKDQSRPLTSRQQAAKAFGRDRLSEDTDSRADGMSSTAGKVSVEVMLPHLEEGQGAREGRFRPGSAIRSTAGRRRDNDCVGFTPTADPVPAVRDEVLCKLGRRPDGQTVEESTKFDGAGAVGTSMGPARCNDSSGLGTDEKGVDVGTPHERTAHSVQPPHVLGYFVGEGHGHHRSSSSPCEDPGLGRTESGSYGAGHPLSPTREGRPPRLHRNSNWGEEGVPLASEEMMYSRKTVPYMVSGTMLGWKLSTRGRKKCLEDSLKASEYSEHALIPVYCFRYADAPEGAIAAEKRAELERLEARASAAERAALKRRARADGGAGGAAFARAMSRRARARADWIQKVGDVVDRRRENMWRGSSPDVLRAYSRRVKSRILSQRLRQRAERGLPSRHPRRIHAVTSRAALDRANGSEKAKDRVRIKPEEGNVLEERASTEPYLMLMRARQQPDAFDARGQDLQNDGKLWPSKAFGRE